GEEIYAKPGELMVLFKEGVRDNDALGLLQGRGLNVRDGESGVFVVVVPPEKAEAVADELRRDGHIKSAVPNIIVFPHMAMTPFSSP
ncbi:MAG: hypothetical protein AAB368_06135, partial [bacterium]